MEYSVRSTCFGVVVCHVSDWALVAGERLVKEIDGGEISRYTIPLEKKKLPSLIV